MKKKTAPVIVVVIAGALTLLASPYIRSARTVYKHMYKTFPAVPRKDVRKAVNSLLIGENTLDVGELQGKSITDFEDLVGLRIFQTIES